MAEPLAVAADENTVESGSESNGFVHICVTLANGFAAEDLLGG